MVFYVLDKLQLLLGCVAMLAWPMVNGGRVKLHGRVRATGIPLLRTCKGARIEIGKGVGFLSSNLFYHAQMFKGVKLLADKPGAVIRIGDGSRVNGACIHAWQEVSIGKNCLIAANVQIMDANGHELAMDNPASRLTIPDTPKPVVIGDNVWIGLNSILLPGTKLGDGCVVAAGSVVKGEFGPRCIIGGIPAKVIKQA